MWNYTILNKWKRKEWHQHHGRIRHQSFCSSSNNLASNHRQKCLCGGCGIQHHTLRELGGGSPILVLDNRCTDLNPTCGSCNSPWTGSSPFRPKNTVLDNHPQMRELLWKSGFPETVKHIDAERKIQIWTH